MRTCVLVLCVTAQACIARASTNTTVQTTSTNVLVVSGEAIHVKKIVRIEPDGITVMHAAGMSKYLFSELPESWQRKYGYDPKSAASYATCARNAQLALAKKNRQQQSELKRKQDASRAQYEKEKQRVELAKNAISIDGMVRKNVPGGVIVLHDIYRIEENQVDSGGSLGSVYDASRKQAKVYTSREPIGTRTILIEDIGPLPIGDSFKRKVYQVDERIVDGVKMKVFAVAP